MHGSVSDVHEPGWPRHTQKYKILKLCTCLRRRCLIYRLKIQILYREGTGNRCILYMYHQWVCIPRRWHGTAAQQKQQQTCSVHSVLLQYSPRFSAQNLSSVGKWERDALRVSVHCAFGISDVFLLYYFVVNRSIGRVESFICGRTPHRRQSSHSLTHPLMRAASCDNEYASRLRPTVCIFWSCSWKTFTENLDNIKQNNRRYSQQFQFRWECATHTHTHTHGAQGNRMKFFFIRNVSCARP